MPATPSRRSVPALVLRAAITTATLTLTALSATGCIVVSGGCGYYEPTIEERRESAVPHVAASALDIRTGNGAIKVESGPVTEARIVAVVRARNQERLAATKVLAERKPDNTLAIYIQWPDGKRLGYEGCSFTVTVPDAAGVTAESSNGAIEIKGLSGKASLDTSNGRITVENHNGDLVAETSNGAIVAKNISGSAHLDTSNGAVTAELGDQSAGPIDVDTSNGAVRVTLGSAFKGTLTYSTSNGNVTLDTDDRAKVVKSGKRSGEIEFGLSSSPASSVRTSNGHVTISTAKK